MNENYLYNFDTRQNMKDRIYIACTVVKEKKNDPLPPVLFDRQIIPKIFIREGPFDWELRLS